MEPLDTYGLTALDYRTRLTIYRHFVERGSAPTAERLAAELALPVELVRESLGRLQAAHALVLAPGTSNIWMAHPFSAVPTPYRVETPGGTHWANCAWDALAIPALLHVDASIAARCPDCAESLRLEVRGGEPISTQAVVHFLVPPRRFWDNVAFT